jgi:hypothetical protein
MWNPTPTLLLRMGVEGMTEIYGGDRLLSIKPIMEDTLYLIGGCIPKVEIIWILLVSIYGPNHRLCTVSADGGLGKQ